MNTAAKLVTVNEKQSATYLCAHNVAEAAALLGISESKVRRDARRLGVQRIAGRTVKGFVVMQGAGGSYPVSLPYSA